MYNPNNNQFNATGAGNFQASAANANLTGPNLEFYSSQYSSNLQQQAQPSGIPQFAGLSGLMSNQYTSNPSYGAGQFQGSSSPQDALQLPTGILAAFSTTGYPGEPSLLEELDVNFSHIKVKTLAVLNPISLNKLYSYNSYRTEGQNMNILNDADLAGPIFFVLAYGINLLLTGKVHFGYIYGCGLLGVLSLYALFKLMSNNDINGSTQVNEQGVQVSVNKINDLDFIRSTSVLGYCLLPLVILSSIGIVISLDNFGGYLFSLLCTIWSTYSASGIFVMVLNLNNSRFLIAYPLFLFYSIFALMAIFMENA